MSNTGHENTAAELQPFLPGTQPSGLYIGDPDPQERSHAGTQLCGVLAAREESNLHIKKVEVVIGNDDGIITDNMHLELDPLSSHEAPKLLASRKLLLDGRVRRAPGRLRSEPAVVVTIEEEQSGIVHHLVISHHKGTVSIETYCDRDSLPESERCAPLTKLAAQMPEFGSK